MGMMQLIALIAIVDPNDKWCPFESRGSWGDGLPRCTTALMESARRSDSNGMKLLLEFNADRSLKDWAGRPALDYAKTDEIRKLPATAQ